MSNPQTRDKILRIGVIQNGTIIEERLLRKRETVSIGSSLRNTLVVPSSKVPSHFTFFDVRGSRYVLNFTPEMSGRVSVGKGVHTLKNLRAHGRAVAQHNVYSIALDERSRGKIIVGDVIFLFQFVTPPPAKPSPQLPVALRGGPFSFFVSSAGLSSTFAASLFFSLLIQVGFVIYLVLEVPPPARPVGVNDLPDRIQMILTETEPEPLETDAQRTVDEDADGVVKADEEEAVEEVADEVVEEQEPQERRSSSGQEPSDEPPRSREERLSVAREQVREAAFWNPLVTSADGVGDPMAQYFNTTDRSVTDVLRRQQARGSATGGLASRTGTLASADGGGEPAGDTVDVDLDGASATRERAERVESGEERRRVRVEARIRGSQTRTAGRGSLNQDTLDDYLRQRVRDIRRCYERVLPEQPDLGGRVVLQFTIDTDGRADDVRLVENEVGSQVGRCIERAVRRWRFDRPDGGSVTVRKVYILEPAS